MFLFKLPTSMINKRTGPVCQKYIFKQYATFRNQSCYLKKNIRKNVALMSVSNWTISQRGWHYGYYYIGIFSRFSAFPLEKGCTCLQAVGILKALTTQFIMSSWYLQFFYSEEPLCYLPGKKDWIDNRTFKLVCVPCWVKAQLSIQSNQ